MHIVFRVDAATWSGSGHVMRCLVLADELSNKYKITFACLNQPGNLIEFIKRRGYDVCILHSKGNIEPVGSNYESWLQQSVDEDAEQFLQHIQEADLLITDHYAIGQKWQSKVRNTLNCKVVAIDDLVRKHDADIVIDQTLGRHFSEYTANSQVLAGSDFAIIANHFASKRHIAISKQCSLDKVNVLISLGGIDANNVTLRILKTLVGNVDAYFTILLSERAPHFSEVSAWCAKHESVTHISFENDMASLMLRHDIAIGAPGTTSWERACLGLPSILIPIANNQTAVAQALAERKATINIDENNIEVQIQAAYYKLLADWSNYHKVNLVLCDGLGTRRVASAIDNILTVTGSAVYTLNKANRSDIKTVYSWQSHPKTREFALNKEVPSWEVHQHWMENKINSVTDYFYMVVRKTDNKKVGVIRLDLLKPDHYLISIYVSPDCYGQGVASAAIKLVENIHVNTTLHATVLTNNLPSHRLFSKMGFKKNSSEAYQKKILRD